MTYKYIPELDYYFQLYWKNRGEITTYHIPEPIVEPDESKITADSFIALLFSEIYEEESYVYMFTEQSTSYFSNSVKDRLESSASSIGCFVTDSITGTENIFSLANDDIAMLNFLFDYRVNGFTNISEIVYSELNTTLSKLIYIYLDLKVNSNHILLATEVPLSSEDNLLESLFEVYVVNEAHKDIKGWNYLIDSVIIKLRPIRDTFVLTQTIIDDSKIILSNNPHSGSDYFIFWNGKLQDSAYYSLMNESVSTPGSDTTSTVSVISWEEGLFDLSPEDIMIVDYQVEVSDE